MTRDIIHKAEFFVALGIPKMPAILMQIGKAALLYFTLVFGAGFVLGIIRTLWVARRLGRRIAELMEAPLMFVVTLSAATSQASWRGLAAFGPTCYGLYCTRCSARRRVRPYALASRPSYQRVSRHARSCVGNCILRAARDVRHHAPSRVQNMRGDIPGDGRCLR